MLNIRARSIEQDLAVVRAIYGEMIDGMSFDFSDRKHGGTCATGGQLGPSGLLVTDYEITEGRSSIPAGGYLKFECPLNGKIIERQGETDYVAERGSALLSMTQKSNMIFRPECRTMRSVSLNVPIAVLQDYLTRSDEQMPAAMRAVSTDNRNGTGEKQLAGLLLHVLEFYPNYTRSTKRAGLVEALILDSFVEYLEEVDYLDWREMAGLRRPTKSADRNERIVAVAEDYIHSHFHLPLTVSEIAAATGVSLRKLQAVFQEYRECTPSAYRSRVRLVAARQKLVNPDENTTVTSAALDCGISHLGRFAHFYFAEYGETPSKSLDRARQRRRTT